MYIESNKVFVRSYYCSTLVFLRLSLWKYWRKYACIVSGLICVDNMKKKKIYKDLNILRDFAVSSIYYFLNLD